MSIKHSDIEKFLNGIVNGKCNHTDNYCILNCIVRRLNKYGVCDKEIIKRIINKYSIKVNQ
jgi:hypothetical protein